ncbi:MAG TPA: dihydrofolate reductase [Steroidobacteraceae bacterium]|jgi:dihydrofolate reductase
MANDALELVVAVSENDVIGRANQLPWRLPADLQHFRALTLGHHILMGRKTYESIGKALPGRTNWILSRSGDFAPADCNVVRTLQDALAGAAGELPLMVIGGAEIYRLCLPQARRIHLTLVHAAITDGDTFFNAWHGPDWNEVGRERHEADARNIHPYSFLTLERRRSAAAA